MYGRDRSAALTNFSQIYTKPPVINRDRISNTKVGYDGVEKNKQYIIETNRYVTHIILDNNSEITDYPYEDEPVTFMEQSFSEAHNPTTGRVYPTYNIIFQSIANPSITHETTTTSKDINFLNEIYPPPPSSSTMMGGYRRRRRSTRKQKKSRRRRSRKH